jgi:hypothetical protein
MNEHEIIEQLKSDGYQKVYVWDAKPGEVDSEHQHDFDVLLVVLEGHIQITSYVGDAVISTSHQRGAHINIHKDTPHSANVGPDGCRYIVAEKHF